MKKQFNVNYIWFDADDASKEIKDQLDEDAQQRIREMSQEGYTSGELIYESDDAYYRGWWSIEKVED